MCMFCVIQKWSRRVATMLPWLVIPLIGLWALSQLLPPPFQFEITSPRLACVFVLLVTLFWYEVLMPYLSAWRVRRNARLRERKRFEALELQKLKKTATRKCRNCLTPYKDQNPGGGKFMCSYCGHISKRPVLDLPIPPGMSNSGLMKELLGKGGKILNGKNWSDNVSFCSQEWLENGNWVVNGSFTVKSSYPSRKNGVGMFGRSESCLAEKSYSGVFFFACKLLMSFFLSVRWLWRKFFWISSSEDSSSDADHRGILAKKGENGIGPESRSEKARRKAEEKRQARLEKELLEEEERKQREEVARLVEERRRLRDEKIKAENRAKATSSLREKDSKKAAERKRQERRREKDKGSSKSNSDVDEVEKKVGKDHEQKRDTERKSENDRRESPKNGVDGIKGHNAEAGHAAKGNFTNNFSGGNVGSRYFDRVRGTFLSSSKAFPGSSFFSRAGSTSVLASKEVKSNSSVDYSLNSNGRRDFHTPERLHGKGIENGDEKPNIRPVNADAQRRTTQMSWHQLFARSPPSNNNVISKPTAKSQMEGQTSQLLSSVLPAPLYDNPIDLPSPFTLPSYSSGPLTSTSSLSAAKDPIFPSVSNRRHDLLPEEPELFEDPCYEPDPVSLLGPVSESLDNFQRDRGSSYVRDDVGKSCPMISGSSLPEVSRPSPIESPLSRLRVADEKQSNLSHFSVSPKVLDMHSFSASDLSNNSDLGTWHMWNSSPLGPDGLSFVGGTANWATALEPSRLKNGDMMHHSSQKTMASLFSKDSHVPSGAYSSQKVLFGNSQTSSGFGVSIHSSDDQDPWSQKAFFRPLSASENHIPVSPTEGGLQKKMVYGSPIGASADHAVDPCTVSAWPKNEWSVEGSREGVSNLSSMKPPVGGLYSVPDVQSLWSFE